MATTKKTQAKKTTAKTAPKKQKEYKSLDEALTGVFQLPTKPEPQPEPEYVEYMIPKRPGFEAVDQFFEYCLNGTVYRFKRGVMLKHPKWLYDAVMRKVQATDSVSEQAAAFQNYKKLN